MSKDSSLNAGLTVLATFFGASAVTLFEAHFWWAVVCAMISVVCWIVYDLLP